MKKPTGNPKANEFHQRALECEAAIRALTSTFGVNDVHPSDEDVELEELEGTVLGRGLNAPANAPNRSQEPQCDVLDVSTDSDSDVQVVGPVQVRIRSIWLSITC